MAKEEFIQDETDHILTLSRDKLIESLIREKEFSRTYFKLLHSAFKELEKIRILDTTGYIKDQQNMSHEYDRQSQHLNDNP